MNYQGKCTKCRKRKDCKVPCAFVDEILKQDNPSLFEIANHAENITIVYPPNHKEVRDSTIRTGIDDKAGHNKIDSIFSTDNENPFAFFNPELKQTGVFIQRVIFGKDWNTISQLYESSIDHVQKLYHKAHTRMIKALELVDGHQNMMDKAQYSLKVNEEATGKLPNYQKWFIMNKCLGMMPADIAEFEGVKRENVTSKIRYCADRLKTGRLTFLDPTPEEIEASQKRIDKKALCDGAGQVKRRERKRHT
ncbi:MAG: hypothetical protein WC799_05535 [Desulfobacteraceae bacterium]